MITEEERTQTTMPPGRRTLDSCITWIRDEQYILENAEFGDNQLDVEEARQCQLDRHNSILNYKDHVDKAIHLVQNQDSLESNLQVARLQTAYATLLNVSKERNNCMEIVHNVASLQNIFSDTCNIVMKEIVDLAGLSKNQVPQQRLDDVVHVDTAFIAKASKDSTSLLDYSVQIKSCISAVSCNWNWVVECANCVNTHLLNAAHYHQFFHEVAECDKNLKLSLEKVSQTFIVDSQKADRDSTTKLMQEIMDALTAFLQWQTRLDKMCERSKSIVPIKRRMEKIKSPTPIKALCDYKTKQGVVKKDDDLILVDNSDQDIWLVKTNKEQQTMMIPSIVCLILPLDAQAIDASLRLRLQLLAIWTCSMKQLGKQLIKVLLLVCKELTDNEKEHLQDLPNNKKQEILDVMATIQQLLGEHWNECPNYKQLLSRMSAMNLAVTKSASSSNRNDLRGTVVFQTQPLMKLLKIYQDFWIYWNSFKVVMETLRQPKYILMCEKWEHLRFVSTAHYIKFWQTELSVDEDEDKVEVEVEVSEETLVAEAVHKEESIAPLQSESAGVTLQSEHKTAETEQITQSIQEETTTLVIKAVIDPNSGAELSMQQAIELGIINRAEGTYNNLNTGDSMAMSEAMSKGLIEVAYSTTKKGEEKKTSVGLITIKTNKQQRPYTILGAIDTKRKVQLTVHEALSKGIINEATGIFKCTKTSEEIPLADAIEQDMIIVEFDSNKATEEEEIKSYAIHAVVDQRKKIRLTFSEAVQAGILDKETGNYINNVTGETLYVADAISKGLIKAHVVDDPSTIENINMENRMYFEKIEGIKKKMLRPVKVINAFRRASGSKDQDGVKNGH